MKVPSKLSGAAESVASRVRALRVPERLETPFARRWASPIFLAAFSAFVSFAQRPWQVYNDTRIELVTAPQRFLGRIPDMWTATMDLGHIQASQFVGYLFPIGPFFALGDWLGLPLWLVQRVWFSLLLAIAGWGIVRLVEATRGRGSRVAGLAAGLIYLASPFVMVSLSRGSVWLVPYAALPWLLVWTRRGIHGPRSWQAPAVVALLLVFTADATITLVIWVVIAMVLLALFEVITGPGLKPTWGFAWRAAVCSLFSALWWFVPAMIQGAYGVDYLTFTEHAEAILATPSASESLRLLGYWVSYVTGFAPGTTAMPGMASYLGDPASIVATFLIPLAAVVSLVFLRRWRYGVFYALLFAFAVLAMSTGFPPDNAVSKVVYDIYYSSGPLQLMRTAYKAAPLAAVAIAVLAGVLASACWASLVGMRRSGVAGVVRTWVLPCAAGVLFVSALFFWGQPLFAGSSVNRNAFFKQVPQPWRDAVRFADWTSPPNTRVAILPGDVFSDYSWGNAQMSVAPGLTDRPVLVRQILRAATPNSAQLVEGTDNLVQQGRLTPGQLNPLLQLMGVGQVIVGTDQAPVRNPTVGPARAALALANQKGFAAPVATFGAVKAFSPPADEVQVSVELPQVRVYAAPKPPTPGIVRVLPRQGPTVMDGDAQGIIAMAGVGALDPARALFYSGALDKRGFAEVAADGARLVWTDSNRRQLMVPQAVNANVSQVLAADEPINRAFPSYDPFPQLGTSGRTTAVYSGLRYLRAPLAPGVVLDPSLRPYAAFDRDASTAWVPNPIDSAHRYLEFALEKPATIGSIRVLPADPNPLISTNGLKVSVNGGPVTDHRLRKGWNTIPVGDGVVRTVRVYPRTSAGYFIGSPAGTIREIEIPGVRPTEALKMPTDLTRLVEGSDLARSTLEVVAERITADFPQTAATKAEANSWFGSITKGDGEKAIRRIVELPGQRLFTPGGWGSVRPDAPDEAIDELSGIGPANRYTSSSRYLGLPANRASSAFDGSPWTSWLALAERGAPTAWIEWKGKTPITFRTFKLFAPLGGYRLPTGVTVVTDQGTFRNLAVYASTVILPREVTTNMVRIEIVAASDPAIAGASGISAKAKRAVAIADIEIPGLPKANPKRFGDFRTGCGVLGVSSGGRSVPVSLGGRLEDLDWGMPLKVYPCGSSLPLKRGDNLIEAGPGNVFEYDNLRLVSAARIPFVARGGPPSVSRSGKISLEGQGWLVLGNTYSRGWTATCTDRAGKSRDLGLPIEIAGFANGWPITGGECVAATFGFAPQSSANVAYVISAIAVAVLILLLVLIRLGRLSSAGPPKDESEDGSWRSWDRKGMAGERVAVISYAASAGLIVATVAIYLLNPASGRSPIGFGFPIERVAAHWTAFAAVVLVGAGGLIDMILVRRGRQSK